MGTPMIILIVLMGSLVIYSTCLITATCQEMTNTMYVWDVFV